jgi:hypothetical protein
MPLSYNGFARLTFGDNAADFKLFRLPSAVTASAIDATCISHTVDEVILRADSVLLLESPALDLPPVYLL